MTDYGVKLFVTGTHLQSTAPQWSYGGSSLSAAIRWLIATVAAVSAMSLQSVTASAQTPTSPTVNCPTSGDQKFFNPPEIVSSDGILKGTVILTEEHQRLPTSINGTMTCAPQLVRNFRGEGLAALPSALPPHPDLRDPEPGPTLRAHVGDLVQLTFVNQVNSNRFDKSFDLEACTQVGQDGQTYPAGFGDKFPNCLHASSTANIHFHGTHTNPNSTGDNVYLQIRPLPRDNQGNLTTTAQQATVGFDEFFKTCTEKLQNPLNAWPAIWDDLPKSWTDKQTELLISYQQKNPGQRLWDENQKVLKDGWPIYYIGAFPYCFGLPTYTGKSGSSPIMGQAPGTHWYHAHKHGSTAINVANGMTGAFIIEGKYDDDLNATAAYGSYVMKDGNAWNTRSQQIIVLNQLGTVPNILVGSGPLRVEGVDFSVNGRIRPKLKMQPGEVQLWRIVNTSGRTAAYFMAPEGLEWRQLAQDGVQFADTNYQNSLNKPFYIAPANRVDLLVKAPMTPMSAEVRIQNVMARSQVKPTPLAPTQADPVPGMALLTVDVEGPPVMRDDKPTEMSFLKNAPDQPEFLADISEEELKRSNYASKQLVFNSTGQHTINDIQFGSEHAHLNVLLGATEEWTIKNLTNTQNVTYNIDHPLHIHINPFQVTEFFDPNENLVDPITGKLEAVLKTGKTETVPRYVTDKSQLADPNNLFAKRQCYLDPANPTTWSVSGACGPQAPQSNLVWRDVFAIPSARTVDGAVIPGYFKMRSRFVDYAGLYVMHCHILIHEDRGMMFSVEVLKAKATPVRHH
jgi:FtsP/CotA-like multicopper oxidase with cupredoxin domain